MLKKAMSRADNKGISNIEQIYLDIGGKSIFFRNIIGIFDMDNATTERATVEFLEGAEKAGLMENLCNDIPVSFAVCENRVYLSPLKGRTLYRMVNKKKSF